MTMMFGVGGQCHVCGCTDEQACPGGCLWANAAATLCSRCARAENAELLEPPGAFAVDDELEPLDAGDWRGR